VERIVEVRGSPHGIKGNTGVLSSQVLLAAEQAGAAVTRLSLSDYEIKPCRACDTCHKTGRCAQQDDFETVRRALQNADGIVPASPNYISNVSAQMKALLDRCCGPLRRNAWDGKYGLVVVTSGGGGEEQVERYLLRFLRAMGCWTVGSVGAEALRLADDGAREDGFQAARELGRRLVQSIRNREVFPDQQPEREAFRNRMRRLVEGNKGEWTFEYEYWQRRDKADDVADRAGLRWSTDDRR